MFNDPGRPDVARVPDPPRAAFQAGHSRKTLMASLPEGITLLIVEGNVILALDVEDMLIRKGANRVDVVGS